MKVAILGIGGMLGRMTFEHLRKSHEVMGTTRKEINVEYDMSVYDMLQRSGLTEFQPDYIINCVGAIKPLFGKEDTNRIYTNAIFPRELANWVSMKNAWGELANTKLVHITTDCVFDGKDGKYTEDSPHNPTDAYGKSKSLGEPDNCMVIRTSIIGPEWGGNSRSLVEWFLSNETAKARGYTNHLWNGLTTLELAKALNTIMEQDLYEDGTFHVYSEDITKYDLLKLMSDKWELDIEIEEAEGNQACDRTLRTNKELNYALAILDQEDMAKELLTYIDMERSV